MSGELPEISFGSDTYSNFNEAIQKEWIVTNGIGGYSSSTILGINTRKYHGFLVASLNPPLDRRVLLTKIDENIKNGNEIHSTEANEFRDGIRPSGYRFLKGFMLNPFPTFIYEINGVKLQKKIFMPYGKNATIVIYEILNESEARVSMRVLPLINSRHFHMVTDRNTIPWDFTQETHERSVEIQPTNHQSALIIYSTHGHYFQGGKWLRRIYFRVEDFRGESCFDDCYQPGFFELNINPGERKKFSVISTAGKSIREAREILSSIGFEDMDVELALSSELQRRRGLLINFHRRHREILLEDWLKWLILAADSFIVNRASTRAKSIIAGYHWFEDWGRDSLISLPGLTLVTGRFEDARQILLTFSYYCKDGVIPNFFPDRAGDRPEYNAVDASLWFIDSVLQYVKYTNDFKFVRERLWNTLTSIIERYSHGTLYGIGVDEDGLLMHGSQLTWMDVIVEGKPITSRKGKAVEIQSLWYNALKTMHLLSTHLNLKEKVKN